MMEESLVSFVFTILVQENVLPDVFGTNTTIKTKTTWTLDTKSTETNAPDRTTHGLLVTVTVQFRLFLIDITRWPTP